MSSALPVLRSCKVHQTLPDAPSWDLIILLVSHEGVLTEKKSLLFF